MVGSILAKPRRVLSLGLTGHEPQRIPLPKTKLADGQETDLIQDEVEVSRQRPRFAGVFIAFDGLLAKHGANLAEAE
ncbi:hypothetical protein PHLCEN_2v8582 [Hermanssonia centrifuga]|uniref:Uncharacterized protein n=1 Tax=Hermanssonia centrifuga TaxID=98765 RepID=A0A2R6NTA8_9APHY|nr:hypothetical protein PHLCEN_2v8582 [Hermanssonia centrifuga]